MSLVAQLTTLVLLFGSQGKAIVAQPMVIALLAEPILIQVNLTAGLAYWPSRRFCVAWHSADRRVQLLGTGRGRRHLAVRTQVGSGAGDGRERFGRSAGDAVGRSNREGVAGPV